MILAWGVLMLAVGLVGASQAALPPDAQALLDTFPEKKITVPLVLGRAAAESDAFRAIRVTGALPEVARLQGDAPYAWNLTGSASRVMNRNEATSPISPTSVYQNQLALGVSRYFPTGTQTAVELSHGYGETALSLYGNINNYETRLTATVAQSLVKDSLGYGARKNLEASERLTEAAKFEFNEKVESWALGLVQVYYDAWLSQAQAYAADDRVARQQRLFGITRIKSQNGTADRASLLQVQGALTTSQVQGAAAAKVLGDRWRGLVIALKLPERWLTVDPKEIPIVLDDPLDEASRACSGTEVPQSQTAKKIRAQALAAGATADRAQNALLPDVALNLQLISNGVDSSQVGNSMSEVFQFAHPSVIVGVKASWPILGPADRANYINAAVQRESSEALSADAAATVRLNWMNACLDLQRLQQSHGMLAENFEAQKKREQLEENQFRLGGTSTLAVIQAGDEATGAEIALRSNEVERRMVAWKIRQMVGKVVPYLEALNLSQSRL